MTDKEADELRCNVLILVTTTSERDALKSAAKEAGLSFRRCQVPGVGRYYNRGMVGATKVNAAPTEMGSLGHQGAAARAIAFAEKALDLHVATGASGIIQLGMGFGVDRASQRLGDVLVSTSLIPYDNRDVVAAAAVLEVMPPTESEPGGEIVLAESDSETAAPVSFTEQAEITPQLRAPAGVTVPRHAPPSEPPPYKTDYTRATRQRAKESLLGMLQREANRGNYEHGIFFGGMLSGGARIFSCQFLAELVNGVPRAEDGIIGGDMEAVGLLSAAPADEPLWIVVKAISDFADEERGRVHQDEAARRQYEAERFDACLNSARFVLRALANAALD